MYDFKDLITLYDTLYESSQTIEDNSYIEKDNSRFESALMEFIGYAEDILDEFFYLPESPVIREMEYYLDRLRSFKKERGSGIRYAIHLIFYDIGQSIFRLEEKDIDRMV